MKSKARSSRKPSPSRVAEPAAAHAAQPIRAFRHTDFRKIREACPFSLADWARMLHLSERTLQRHEQQQGALSPIHAERALQLADLVKAGAVTFGDAQTFYNWLRMEPPSPSGVLSPALLESYQGIEAIRQQLHRIQQGLFA